jgi:Kef-type K+ transport system membrane component KefB
MDLSIKKVFSSHFEKYLSKVNKINNLYDFYHQIFIISSSLFFTIFFMAINYYFDITRIYNLYICLFLTSYFFYSVFFAPQWFFKLINKNRIFLKYKSYSSIFKKQKIQIILSTINNINKKEFILYESYIKNKLKKLNNNEIENLKNKIDNEFVNFDFY